MKEPINIDATIKSAFNSVIKIITNKLERTKSHRTIEEYENLKNDIDYLRGIATNPAGFFRAKKEPNDIYKELGKLLDLSILEGHYSPQPVIGTRVLDSLMLYSAAYYNAEKWNDYKRKESIEQIVKLNKFVKLKSAAGMTRALGVFRVFAPAEHFAVRENQK